MTKDRARGADAASVRASASAPREKGVWHCRYRIDKYDDGVVDGSPDEVLRGEGNLLCDNGIDAMMNLLALGAGTAYTNGVNACVAVGSGVVAADRTDTTLGAEYAATGRKLASAIVTDQSVAFLGTFPVASATGDWKEVGVFNDPTLTIDTGDMLNHIVSALGNKAAGAAWVLTITITIS